MGKEEEGALITFWWMQASDPIFPAARRSVEKLKGREQASQSMFRRAVVVGGMLTALGKLFSG